MNKKYFHKTHWIRGLALALVFLTIFLGNMRANGETILDLEFGAVDWENGTVNAMGLGIPPENFTHSALGSIMAKRAAIAVARQRLLEMIQGISVDSTTGIGESMEANDSFNSRVKGFVRNARVVKARNYSDGSVEVQLEMGLKGSGLASLSAHSEQLNPTRLLEGIPSGNSAVNYTGLVVNAQGLSLREALSPKILIEDGQYVYTREFMSPEIARKQPVVSYFKDLSKALTAKLIGNNPLVIKALRVDGNNPTDVVINDADAQMLHMIPEHVEFLKEGKVIFVY